MDEIREMLDRQIDTEISNLTTMESGSEEKSKAIDDLAKLYKLRIEETRSEYDFEKSCQEAQLKTEQLMDQDKDRYFRIGLEAVGIVIPLIFYGRWMNKGFKFEETGTFTSTTFRGLFSKFKPTRK